MPGFRYNRKKVALTYSCPRGEQHPWCDKELAYLALDEHFSAKGKTIVNYLVAEELHQSGELHYHAYLEFDSRIDTIDVNYFNIMGMHPNIGNKPGKAWLVYCTKKGNYVTNFYEPNENIYERAIKLGGAEGMEYIKENNPYVWITQQNKLLSALTVAYQGPRRVVWCYGPSGSGKSYWADQHGAVDTEYENKFYDYAGAETVVFNEIDKMSMPLNQFLKITDVYKKNVNIKGASMPWAAKTIIFTSTVPWDGVFVHEHAWQVDRRITDILEFHADHSITVHRGSDL